MLKVEDLHFSYGSNEILKGVSFEAWKGEVIGLLGPNGCGKSTLIKALAGVHKGQGRITIDTLNNQRVRPEQARSLIGYVPQGMPGDINLSALDSLLLARRSVTHDESHSSRYKESVEKVSPNNPPSLSSPHSPNNSQSKKQTITQKYDEKHSKVRLFGNHLKQQDTRICLRTLQDLGILHLAQRNLSAMSGGQRQLVSMAQMLVRNPIVMLLDEPTSALDLRHQLNLLRLVKKYTSEDTVSLVAIHDLNLAAMHCTRLMVLNEGKIIAHGTPEEIIKEDIIRDVYRVESKILSRDDIRLMAATELTEPV